MKKIFSIAIVALFTLTALTSNAQRWGTSDNKDNTGRVVTYKELTPAYSATVTVTPNASYTYVKPAALTGELTVNATETNAKKYDEITFIFTCDTSIRIVTFGTNFVSSGTLTLVASKQGTARFVYDGSNYVEISRTIQL